MTGTPTNGDGGEPVAVVARYARREKSDWRYDPLNPSAYMAAQERQRAMVRLVKEAGLPPLSQRTALEIGCGAGGNLLELLQLGFVPGNLCGNELLPERLSLARSRLPQAIQLLAGDANTIDLPTESFDLVLQSTVFTSILDPAFQIRLAERMWKWTKRGGGVLWYDFVYDNPKNPDVKGVPLARVRQLFPDGRIRAIRVTLAPPISRLVTRIHPSMYLLFGTLPQLRTHLLCWIGKP